MVKGILQRFQQKKQAEKDKKRKREYSQAVGGVPKPVPKRTKQASLLQSVSRKVVSFSTRTGGGLHKTAPTLNAQLLSSPPRCETTASSITPDSVSAARITAAGSAQIRA